MSSRVAIDEKNYLPVIEIVKNDSSVYTFNHFLEDYDFRLRLLDVTPPIDAAGGDFTLQLISNSADPVDTNTIYENLGIGNEIVIYLGKTDAGKEKKFRGIIESPERPKANKNHLEIRLTGPDWGSHILQSRRINGVWIQDKEADGITIDTSDLTTTVKNIVIDILSNLAYYPFNDFTLEDMGVIVDPDLIDIPEIQLPKFQTNYEVADDVLRELDRITGARHWIDADKYFHMDLAEVLASPSGVLLTDDYEDTEALSWTSGKVGLIKPNHSVKQTGEHMAARLIGLGGSEPSLDQKHETNSGSVSLHDKYYAVRFDPTKINLESYGIYVSKVGSPTIDLFVELYEDAGGEPKGGEVRTLSIQKEAMVGPAWHYLDIGEELNTAKSYWIVLRKVGDASNTYLWYHGGTSGGNSLESADGITWTPGTTQFMFRTYTSSPVIAVVSAPVAATSKFFKEDVINKPEIKDSVALFQFLIKLSETAFKIKEIFKGSIYMPDVLLDNGDTVTIKTTLGETLRGDFVVGQTTYTFMADGEGVLGLDTIEIQATRYITFY